MELAVAWHNNKHKMTILKINKISKANMHFQPSGLAIFASHFDNIFLLVCLLVWVDALHPYRTQARLGWSVIIATLLPGKPLSEAGYLC